LFKASYGRYYVYPYIANWSGRGQRAGLYTYWWNGSDWELIDSFQGSDVHYGPDINNPYYDSSRSPRAELAANFSLG